MSQVRAKKPDYSNWPTKQQAADRIGVSTKQLERWAQDKRLQSARWKRPEGGPAIVVYHPDDVERIAGQRNPGEPFVVPEEPTAAGNGTKAIAKRQPPVELFLEAMAAAVSGGSENSETRVRLADKLYLTVDEAAHYTGLGAGYLRRKITEGALVPLKGAGPHGADVVRRADLEKL